MKEEDTTMKQISIDNGATMTTPEQAIAAMPWETIVQAMDDETRERVHAEIAPCDELAFLRCYLEQAPTDLVIG